MPNPALSNNERRPLWEKIRLRVVFAASALALLAAPVAPLGGADSASSGALLQEQSGKKRMGVPAFETNAANKMYGERMAELLVTDLMQNRNYDLIERNQLDRVIQEQGLGASGIVDQSNVAQIGKVAGLDYIVLGTLTEASSIDKDNSWTDKNGKRYPSYSTVVKVVITVRVIEVETGKIVLSASGENSETLSWGETPKRATLDHVMGVAKKAIKKAAFKVMDRIAPNLAKVLKADKDAKGKSYTEAIINQGHEDGIREGAKFVIFREGEVLTDPDTGEVLDVQMIDVAYITVTKVNPRSATAKVVKVLKDPKTKKEYEILRGDMAKMQDETEARSWGEVFGLK